MGLGEKVSETLKEVFEPLTDAFLWPIQKAIEWSVERLSERLEQQLAPELRPFIESLEKTGQIPPEFAQLFQSMKQPPGFAWALLLPLLAVSGFNALTGTLGRTVFSGLDKSLNALFQPNLLDPRSIVTAERRHSTSETLLNQEWLWTGWVDFRREILRDVTRPLLDIDTLRQLHLRFPQMEVVVNQILESYGFRKGDIESLKLIWQVIPGPQDQVRFAVREAFDEATISKYNLGAFFPTAFGEEVAKVGLPIEWARRYWYSHWELPSVGQGYEMLHRDVIDLSTLQELMRYRDILPWWHDKLIAIAYNPYTRVDVRRMHSLGILDRAAVKRSYLDLGFDDEKAENMTRFTLAYNQAANRDLSRSDITDGYKRGLLDRGEALEDLKALGYDDLEIGFYLDREEVKKEQARKSQYSARYKRLYVKNLIDEAQLRAEMVPLGFTGAEITELVTVWTLEKRATQETTFEEKERDLARADVTDGYKREIFSQAEATELLGKLGYDKDEIDFYLTREDYKRDEAQAQDLITAYRRQYLTGVIDENGVKTALVGIPLPPERVSGLLALWSLDKASQEWSPVVPQERDLTRADILDAYRKRLITYEETTRMLAELGYDLAETELLVAKTDYEGEKTRKQLSLSTYRNLYTSGLLDKTDTTAALADLGYETQEIEHLYSLWDIELVGNLKMPSRSDLARFLKKDIINLAQWRELMAHLGYPDTVISWYEEDMTE